MPHFQTKPIAVEAVQLRCSYVFGKARGRAGDWLVIHADGRQEIVGAEELELALKPFAEAGRRFWVTGDGTFADAYTAITGEDLRHAWQALEGKR